MPASRHPFQLTSISLAILALAGCAQGAAATSASGLEVKASMYERFSAGDYQYDPEAVGCIVRFDATNTSDSPIEEIPSKVTLINGGESITELDHVGLVGDGFDFGDTGPHWEVRGPVQPGDTISWIRAVDCDELDADGTMLDVDGATSEVNL